MGVAAYLVDRWLAAWLPGPALPLQLVRVAGAIAAAVGVLALSAWLLKIREFHEGLALVMRRFGRTRP
jgi:hypothetical protein